MAAAADVLARARNVLVVDWPSRDVPETLARHGFTVVVHGGPGPTDYTGYGIGAGGEVVVEEVGQEPTRADVVYSYRPLDELPGIVEAARRLGASAVWVQSGRSETGDADPEGCWMPPADAERARALVESAGLAYVDRPYIVDAVRRAAG